MSRKEDHFWQMYLTGVKHRPGKLAGRKKVSAQAASNSLIIAPVSPKTAARNIKKAPGGKAALPNHWASGGKFDIWAGGDPQLRELDRKATKRWQQGEIEIDSKLDLHGMTQSNAHAALVEFLTLAIEAGHRHLLIVTGKGSKPGSGGRDGKPGGVIRANLESWLAALPERSQILSLRPAADRHGGAGAFYVILRQRRNKG